MLLFQGLCLVIVLAYLGSALTRASSRRVYLRRFALLCAASWLVEDSCVRLYGLYAYDPSWLLLDRVPLLVVLIWPTVILSAAELAGHLRRRGGAPSSAALALTGGALVLGDASFIEPIAVQARLWSWTEPGILGVPPIGLVGWGLFAGLCHALLGRSDRRGARAKGDLATMVLAPLLTHAGLLALWWSAARWLTGGIPPWAAVTTAWLVSLGLTSAALHGAVRRRIPASVLTTRIPASLLFLGLLAVHGRRNLPLVIYAAAFPAPYLALIDWRSLLR